MRVWLNPVQMTGLGITPAMVIAAIQAQNLQVSAGQIGEAPTSNNQAQQLTVLAPGELTNVQQFKNIVIRATPNGGIVRLSDIARVQLAAEQYDNLGGARPPAGLDAGRLPGAFEPTRWRSRRRCRRR